MTGVVSIVALGGTVKPASSTDLALRTAVATAEAQGARVTVFEGTFLAELPHYGTPAAAASPHGAELVAAVRAADGLIVASPGYHGTISGLVKNAIDYLEETARDPRPYLDGIPVGLIATAYGWQATGSTLAALRATVHALRGWPTPFGAAINGLNGTFVDGRCADPVAERQLRTIGQQVYQFARMTRDAASVSGAVA